MRGLVIAGWVLGSVLAGPVLAGFPENERGADAARLKVIAEQCLRDGDKACAAEAYERILALDPSDEIEYGASLVQVYVDLGNAAKALDLAGQLRKYNPRPDEYMASVHAQLGQYDAAESLLDKVCAGTNRSEVAMACLQLAGVCEKKGSMEKARKSLEKAVSLSKGLPTEQVATRVLGWFNERHPPAGPLH